MSEHSVATRKSLAIVGRPFQAVLDGLERPSYSVAIVRGLVYSGAVLLLVGRWSLWAGTLAALAGVPLGFLLSRWMIARRLRFPVMGAVVLSIFGLGMAASPLFCGPAWVARLLGLRMVLTVGEAATFGLMTLACVAGLRYLAARWPILTLLEAAVVVAVVTSLFAGHRDFQIGQPRSPIGSWKRDTSPPWSCLSSVW